MPASRTVFLDDPVRDTSLPSTARSKSWETRLTESAADAKAKTGEPAAEKAAAETVPAVDKDESSEEDDTSTESDEDYQYSDSTISIDSDSPTPTRWSVEKASSPVSLEEQTAGTNVKEQEEEGAAMKRQEDSAMGTTIEFMSRGKGEDEAYAEKVEAEALLAKNKAEEEKLKIVDAERKSREQEESNRNEDEDSLESGRTLIGNKMPTATCLGADALEKHLEHKKAEREEETDARKAAVERERTERERARASDDPAEHALTEETDATEMRQHASPDAPNLNADKAQNSEDIDTNHAGKIDDRESKPQAVEISAAALPRYMDIYIYIYIYI